MDGRAGLRLRAIYLDTLTCIIKRSAAFRRGFSQQPPNLQIRWLILAYLSLTHEGVRLSIHVQPRARQSALVGLHGDAVKIALNVPPVEGRANEALRRFLADLFHLPFSHIAITSGLSSRHKTVLLEGCSLAAAQGVLSAAGITAAGTEVGSSA